MDAPRIPAWKKLGLKLKSATDIPERVPPTADSNSGSISTQDGPLPKRRRLSTDRSIRKSVISSASLDSPSPTKPKKKVSFTSDTKTRDGDTSLGVTAWNMDMVEAHLAREAERNRAASNQSPETNGDSTNQESEPVQPKKLKPAKPQSQHSKAKSIDALHYLTQFYHHPESWKFNKNREVWILKHSLSTTDIPSSMNLELATYIQGLKSIGARTRLSEDCRKALKPNHTDFPNDDGTEDSATRKAFLEHISFPHSSNSRPSLTNDLALWIETQPRAQLLLLALGISNITQPITESGKSNHSPNHVNGVSTPNGISPAQEPKQKKRKNRTLVVEYSSSSSGVSSSEGSSGEESENENVDSETDSDESNDNAEADETSSSGSSSGSDSNS